MVGEKLLESAACAGAWTIVSDLNGAFSRFLSSDDHACADSREDAPSHPHLRFVKDLTASLGHPVVAGRVTRRFRYAIGGRAEARAASFSSTMMSAILYVGALSRWLRSAIS